MGQGYCYDPREETAVRTGTGPDDWWLIDPDAGVPYIWVRFSGEYEQRVIRWAVDHWEISITQLEPVEIAFPTLEASSAVAAFAKVQVWEHFEKRRRAA